MSITGDRMQERRKKLGYSADMLAKYLGVSRSTIFRYENGDIEKVPANLLSDIAKFLQTSEAYLMGWDKLETKEIKDTLAFNNYLKSLGYLVETQGTGKAIKDEDGNVVGAEHLEHTLTKNGTVAVFKDGEWENFKTEIQKTVDYQVWKNKI